MTDEKQTSEGNELSPAVQRAMEQGWVPLEAWQERGRDPDEWVDHKEFNFRGELMSRIQNQTHQLKQNSNTIEELKTVLSALTEHNKKIGEIERKKVIAELRQQQSEATNSGDFNRVSEIEDKIDEVKAIKLPDLNTNNDNKNTTEAKPKPEFISWYSKPENQWYGKDVAMTAAADAFSISYMQARGGPDQVDNWNDLLKHVDNKMREEFPHKFNRASSGMPILDSDSRPGGIKVKGSYKNLTAEQRKIGNSFVQMGVFENLQEYAAQLAELGEL